MSDDHQLPADQVAALWNWLPAFRVVAETENLRIAAERLFVTPSALSRTIKLLEDTLGRALFDRKGRRLQLNEEGRILLSRTRGAMRGIDEGLRDLFGDRYSGKVVVSSVGVATSAVLMVLERMRALHATLIPVHRSLVASEVSAALRAGEIDIAFHEAPLVASDLVIEKLVTLENKVYCGPGHPLYRAHKPTMTGTLKHAFVAPPTVEGQPPLDGWPVEVERQVGLVVERLDHAQSICERGNLLCVLPDTAATRAQLRSLPSPPLPLRSIYAMHRIPVSDDDLGQEVLAMLKNLLMSFS